MTWLAPIGFLGLIGIVLLIVIYIIKPNYEKKMVSSTYVWHLSLKYRKKRLPISRLNNILTFLCQFLILTICALLLAQPVIQHEKIGDENEKSLLSIPRHLCE
ncbi:MAG: BatA domain-containing protein [Clostridia bacterium]|nr:BatA domain-containing protein [Clostridia bacterium]